MVRPAERWLSVGRLARRHGLSRTTLLYYDRIGLLRPDGRTRAGYRTYGPDAQTRLARICELRLGGVPLERIAALLDDDAPLAVVLENQLVELNRAIAGLERQRLVVSGMLGVAPSQGPLTKEGWTAMFAAIGLSEEESWAWHAEFERSRPLAHERFLGSLGLSGTEIDEIRRRAAGVAGDASPA
jgi:DNA-binding transcriptional MerR regulator